MSFLRLELSKVTRLIEKENGKNMAIAKLRHLRIAPRKMRVVAGMVRGKDVGTAINHLRFVKKSGSQELFGLIISAVANAEDQGEDVENLVISKLVVDQGPTLKRWRPRAQGRGARILKKTSHVVLEVTPQVD